MVAVSDGATESGAGTRRTQVSAAAALKHALRVICNPLKDSQNCLKLIILGSELQELLVSTIAVRFCEVTALKMVITFLC